MAHNPQEDLNRAAVKALAKESKAAKPAPTKKAKQLEFLDRLESRLRINVQALRNSNLILHDISLSIIKPSPATPSEKTATIHYDSWKAAIPPPESILLDGSFIEMNNAPNEQLPRDLEVRGWLDAPCFSGSAPVDAFAKARLAALGEDAIFSEAWARLCSDICDADVLLRRSRAIPLASYSMIDAMKVAAGAPLSGMSRADMLLFEKARRKANASRPPIFRDDLYSDLAAFIRANITLASKEQKLTFSQISVEENSSGAIKITSLHVLGREGEMRIFADSGNCLQIVVDPLPFEAKGFNGISKMIQKRRLLALGQEEFFVREWRRVASLLARADSKARVFFDCPAPPGLSAIVELGELTHAASSPQPSASPAKRRNTL